MRGSRCPRGGHLLAQGPEQMELREHMGSGPTEKAGLQDKRGANVRMN